LSGFVLAATRHLLNGIKRQDATFYFRLAQRKPLTGEAETHLKGLLHPLAIPTAGTRYRLRRDFQDDEALGGKRLHFARRRITERDRLPLREIDLGITERQHLTRLTTLRSR
jgi:hypothetical protein